MPLLDLTDRCDEEGLKFTNADGISNILLGVILATLALLGSFDI